MIVYEELFRVMSPVRLHGLYQQAVSCYGQGAPCIVDCQCCDFVQIRYGQFCCRRRLLTAMGWNVMSVPYFDWSRLQSGLDKVGIDISYSGSSTEHLILS